MDLSAVPGLLTLGPPASDEAIATATLSLAAGMPEEYSVLLRQADGVAADAFVLYACDELSERNEILGIGESAPGYVAIGDDNGGRAIVLRGGPGRSPVWLVGHGSMSPADMKPLAGSLDEWVKAGCPLAP
jgi:hypothetical protein